MNLSIISHRENAKERILRKILYEKREILKRKKFILGEVRTRCTLLLSGQSLYTFGATGQLPGMSLSQSQQKNTSDNRLEHRP